jgi:hypothetical protein
MNKFLLTGALASLLSLPLLAQTPVTPKPAPGPTPRPRPSFLEDNQLMEMGGFERPKVWRPSTKTEGGDPVLSKRGEWIHFKLNTGGQIVAGLSNDVARTGKQSIFVRFDHAKVAGANFSLTSGLFPVKPNESYRVSIYGKIDPKSPITIDQRLPVLLLQTDFFLADGETQTGESQFKIQPMPGSLNRPPEFTTDKWGKFAVDVTSPDDAAYIKIAWSWGLVAGEGETTGTIYFDDAGIVGAKPDDTAETPAAATGEKPPEGTAPVAPAAPAPPAPEAK